MKQSEKDAAWAKDRLVYWTLKGEKLEILQFLARRIKEIEEQNY